MKCAIRFAEDERPAFQMDAPGSEGYVIGRGDEALHYAPDIDLGTFDSRDKGVSRRHAALINYQGVPHIIDLFSANGTYLNGKRLPPDQPYPLGQFNELRLGTLHVIITIS
ncbi:MAG: FHA domain-containing protein [Chloroflexi bacterium]|nr:FHA domain-containing protein [Chloroflexota bacterium]